MAQKGTFQPTDKYISAILYFLLMVALYTFYFASTDVLEAVLKYDYAKNTWIYNAGGTLIISLLILIGITIYSELRLRAKPSILTADNVRKVILTITNVIFVITFIFAIYKMLDSFLHGEYQSNFYINQVGKLLISGMVLTYSFKALKRTTSTTPLLMTVLSIGIIISGIGLFSTNIYFSPSLKELRLKREDEVRNTQLRACTNLINDFAGSHKTLPKSLEEVAVHTGKPKVLQDPITHEDFVYRLKGKKAEVCAIFHSPFPLEHENLFVNPTNPHERCRNIKENGRGNYYDY